MGTFNSPCEKKSFFLSSLEKRFSNASLILGRHKNIIAVLNFKNKERKQNYIFENQENEKRETQDAGDLGWAGLGMELAKDREHHKLLTVS